MGETLPAPRARSHSKLRRARGADELLELWTKLHIAAGDFEGLQDSLITNEYEKVVALIRANANLSLIGPLKAEGCVNGVRGTIPADDVHPIPGHIDKAREIDLLTGC